MKFWSRVAIVCSVLVCLAGCGGSGGSTNVNTDPRVSFLNASVDAGQLDFYIDDDKKASALPFGSLTGIGTTSVGEHDQSITAAGTSQQLDANISTYNNDTDQFVYAIGQATPDSGDTYGITKKLQVIYSVINAVRPTGNRCRLVLVQGFSRASGFQTPQVDFKAPGDNVDFTNKVVNIDPFTARAVDVDISKTDWVLQRSGTQSVYIPTTTFTLEGGAIYLVVASGIEGGTGAQAPKLTLIRYK